MKQLAFLVTLVASLPAFADGERPAAPLAPQYLSECGSCHVAFPPQLLGRADWQKTLATLDRHFGTDASVDPATRDAIGRYLERNAGTRKASRPAAEPRITRTSWFLREHDEVPARVWKDPRVKSAANCAACHGGAEQGRYGEAEITLAGMPRRHVED